MGILVHAVPAKDAIKQVNEGKFDEEIRTEKTELTAEEKAKLEEERKRLAEEIEKRRAEFEKMAKDIIAAMAGKERGTIKAKLAEAGVPDKIIKELLPVEGATAGAEGKPAVGAAAGAAAKPAAGAAAGAAAKPESKKEEAKGKEKKK